MNLPVIALAIPLQACIHVIPHDDANKRVLLLSVPQLGKSFEYDLVNLPPRQTSIENADFALAALHEALDDGWSLSCGATCTSTTSIVLQAGCSSSTAFTIAWILVLARLAGVQISDPLDLARLAHKAEVLHFGAPGGTMDHVSIAMGGSCMRIGPGQWDVETLPALSPEAGVWVLADSGDVKDTFGHLKRCKNDRLVLLDKLGGTWDSQDGVKLGEDEASLLKATLTNRDCEVEAARLWRSGNNEDANLGANLGNLMLRHHEALRDGLKLSTRKLEAMRQAAMDSGAWGFKLVGSGGGGCAVAWCSKGIADRVCRAMESVGAKQTWIVDKPSQGARVEPM